MEARDFSRVRLHELIAFRKEGYFGTKEQLVFEAFDERVETLNTVKLLEDVYYGITTQKKIEAKVLRKCLRDELSKFKGIIRDYDEAEGEDKKDLELYVKKELKNNSTFTSFKRWLIKDHCDYYPEFMEYVIKL